MRHRALALALLCAAPLAAGGPMAVAQEEAPPPIRPGYWESHSKMTVGPLTLGEKTERKCLTAKDMNTFMQGPSNRHYACDYPVRNFDDGKVSMAGECVHRKKGTHIAIRLKGSYTSESFDMIANLRWGILSGAGVSSAHRIGDVCPVGSEIK